MAAILKHAWGDGSFSGEVPMRVSTIVLSLPLVIVLLAPARAQQVLTGDAAFGTWEADAPGVRRHIMPSDLPAPSNAENDPEAPDFENMANVVPAPEGRMPDVPKGFAVQVFASGLNRPRVIRTAPDGDIFVAESGAGRVLIFTADSAGGAPASPEIFAEGLDRPFGIAFYPPAKPRYVYVAE